MNDAFCSVRQAPSSAFGVLNPVVELARHETHSTMLVRNIALLCATALIAGCMTYQDPRSRAEQRAALHAAADELAGSYEVADSRNDDGRCKYARVTTLKTCQAPIHPTRTWPGDWAGGWSRRSSASSIGGTAPVSALTWSATARLGMRWCGLPIPHAVCDWRIPCFRRRCPENTPPCSGCRLGSCESVTQSFASSV